MATFILVHGGGHGGWCYGKVTRLLRNAGHDVYAPTLTGLGERQHLVTPDTNLTTHITDVVNTMEYEDLDDVILVGHSYGGMVITGVADRAPGRIRELVYLDAAHPVDGESLNDIAPTSMARTRKTAKTVDGVELVMWPDDETVAGMGVSDPDDAAWLRSKMTPHPWNAFSERLAFLNGDAATNIPRTNINCAANLRGSNGDSRQTIGHRNYVIDTGHDVMVTEPVKLTNLLVEIAAS